MSDSFLLSFRRSRFGTLLHCNQHTSCMPQTLTTSCTSPMSMPRTSPLTIRRTRFGTLLRCSQHTSCMPQTLTTF